MKIGIPHLKFNSFLSKNALLWKKICFSGTCSVAKQNFFLCNTHVTHLSAMKLMHSSKCSHDSP